MITKLFWKILFPRQQPWQRGGEARAIMAAILVALVFATLVGLVIVWRNSPANNRFLNC
jgi:hypothetical protein